MAIDHAMPVLVVDDYKTMVRIIRNLLKQLGYSEIDDADVLLREHLEEKLQTAVEVWLFAWLTEPAHDPKKAKHHRLVESRRLVPHDRFAERRRQRAAELAAERLTALAYDCDDESDDDGPPRGGGGGGA